MTRGFGVGITSRGDERRKVRNTLYQRTEQRWVMTREHGVCGVPFIERAHRWRFRNSIDEIHANISGDCTGYYQSIIVCSRRGGRLVAIQGLVLARCQAPFFAESTPREFTTLYCIRLPERRRLRRRENPRERDRDGGAAATVPCVLRSLRHLRHGCRLG